MEDGVDGVLRQRGDGRQGLLGESLAEMGRPGPVPQLSHTQAHGDVGGGAHVAAKDQGLFRDLIAHGIRAHGDGAVGSFPDDGAAAQADDGPGPQLPGPPGAGVHVVTGGIGLHLRDDVQHAAARALIQPRGHAAAVGEGIGDDQRPVQPPLGHKLSQLIQLPGAEDHFHRVVILPHGSNSSLLVGTA